MSESDGLSPGTRVLKMGSLSVVVGCQSVKGKMLWHVTISHPTRCPRLDEIDGVLSKVVPYDARMTIDMRNGVKITRRTVHLWEKKHDQASLD